jgi:hypothetical protein
MAQLGSESAILLDERLAESVTLYKILINGPGPL